MPPDSPPPLSLTTRVSHVPGVGTSRGERLAKLGVKTAQDLLFLFPRDYEFPAPPAQIDNLVEDQPASLVGLICETEVVSRHAGKSVFGALVENETGCVRILFFNQPFRAETLTRNTRVMISGVPRLSGLRWEFVHPKVTILAEGESMPEPKPLPIYPLTEGLKQVDLRRVTKSLTAVLSGELKEVMPASLLHRVAEHLRVDGFDFRGPLPGIAQAIRQIHHPANESEMTAARLRFVFQELFVMQLALAMRRRQLTTNLKAPIIETSAMIDARIVKRFGFELTADQRQAIEEIRRDMSRRFPMNRLLQGDVGSGKTVVAAYAMLATAAAGYQSVLMAPTEVLARQHYDTFCEMLDGSKVRIGLLCGSIGAAQRREVLQKTAEGEIDLLIGTQALVSGKLDFAKLGLCVIDEQHKFGVAQRVSLRGAGVDPHSLVLSATPIPRSVAMTLFGDVDLSTIREKPPGRGEVNTYLADDQWRDRWWGFVRQRLDEGRQAYVVAPRVEATATEEGDEAPEDVSSVQSVFAELSKDVFSNYRVALLHGSMDHAAKQSVMRDFAAGRIDVLVSTTVIEVGINIPNATVMTILGAERFGLAQLHQLRGRVSRGAFAGHVTVFTDGPQSPEENERLAIFQKTNDGFELAEADFRLRGPGDLLGRRQSGLPPMKIADLTRDIKVLTTARALAQAIVEEDPQLQAEELKELKEQVMRRYQSRLNLGDVA
jgi:ATP-dependent DNA helicase RecG